MKPIRSGQFAMTATSGALIAAPSPAVQTVTVKFRWFLPLLAITCMLASESSSFAAPPTPPAGKTWVSTFTDDFNTIDGTKWRQGQHWAGFAGGAGDDPNMITVSSGALNIKIQKRSYTSHGVTKSYAGGQISTFKRFRQLGGYFECRAKFSGVKGLWPAFWLMPDRGNYGNADKYKQSYIKFSPGTKTSITSATLKLTVAATVSQPKSNILIKRVNDSWAESTVTWNNKPTQSCLWIKQYYRVPTYTAGQVLSIDVKAYAISKLGSSSTISFELADTYMETGTPVTFCSRENTTQSKRPQLVIVSSSGTQTYYATEDAYVQGGSQANIVHGSATTLAVQEDWGDCSTTKNGGMETDIMESQGIDGPNSTYHTVHWDGYPSKSATSGKKTFSGVSPYWHTYGLWWTPGVSMKFYIDGVPKWTWTNSRACTVPCYMILDQKTGGWGDNKYPVATVHDKVFNVDYVKVWQLQ